MLEIPDPDWCRWFVEMGVPGRALVHPTIVKVARGAAAPGGFFDFDPAGDRWLCFEERDDLIFWHPGDGTLCTDAGRAFALGEAAVGNPATFAFDCNLNIFENPMDWLRAGRDGIVILKWRWAFDRLRDVPRIAVDERLLPVLKEHMRPPHSPEIYVMTERRRGWAA